MREMSASEAARNFSAVLDAVEGGDTVVVLRSGRRVATIGRAPATSGNALREVVQRWRGASAFDDRFAANVKSATEAVDSGGDVDPWNG